MSQIADGFFLLFRGFREMFGVKGKWWLLTVPILLNLLIFVVLVWALLQWPLPAVFGWLSLELFAKWASFAIVGKVIAWLVLILVFSLVLILYALVFSLIAEVLGAPFYEEIGMRIDKKKGVSVVERPWYKEVWFAVTQESRKLVVLVLVSLVIFVLQFAPVVGQLLSMVLGFGLLVITAGADAVGPALARRGLMLRDRRKWVLGHLRPVLGLGIAKALGLVVPAFNIVVLPMASAGGTLLVQKYGQDT